MMLAAMGFAVASCSNDDPAVISGVNSNDGGFAQFDIKLPQVAASEAAEGTRAASFEQGTASEYAVKNGKIIVFKKADKEASATFVCSADLNGMNWSNGAAGEITTTSSGVAQLSNINLTDASAYGVVVVLNYANDFVFPTTGQTFGQWSKTAQTGALKIVEGNNTYITMTNAARVGSGEPVVLADLDKSKVAQSESAISGSATTVYVQRALAKVSVSTSAKYTPTGGSYTHDEVTINAWALDITNKSSYPVQVTEGLSAKFAGIWSKDRFFGGSKFVRAYWAIDPNYDQAINSLDKVNAAFNVIGDGALTGVPASVYCMENTFDVNHQMQGQTTRVVFKATYKPQNIPAGENFYKIGASTALWNATDLQAQILAKAKTALQRENLTVDLATVKTKGGYHTISDVVIKKGTETISAAEYDLVAKSLGLTGRTDASIATYDKGVTYYVARVKHFGDADCPWKVGDPTYGGNNDKYLGRYGIVRNNWYEVAVKSISNPGSPVIPVIKPEVPDDENEYYIQAQVNILSWAKRVQNVDL